MKTDNIVRRPFVTRLTPEIVIESTPGGDPEYESYILPDGGGGEVWQLDVGAECNLLLAHAEGVAIGIKHGADMVPTPSQAVVDAIRSIVRRVAEFEALDYDMDSPDLPAVPVSTPV